MFDFSLRCAVYWNKCCCCCFLWLVTLFCHYDSSWGCITSLRTLIVRPSVCQQLSVLSGLVAQEWKATEHLNYWFVETVTSVLKSIIHRSISPWLHLDVYEISHHWWMDGEKLPTWRILFATKCHTNNLLRSSKTKTRRSRGQHNVCVRCRRLYCPKWNVLHNWNLTHQFLTTYMCNSRFISEWKSQKSRLHGITKFRRVTYHNWSTNEHKRSTLVNFCPGKCRMPRTQPWNGQK